MNWKWIYHTSDNCGLANRLRGLVGSLAISQVLQIPIRLDWVPDISCPGDFSEALKLDWSRQCGGHVGPCLRVTNVRKDSGLRAVDVTDSYERFLRAHVSFEKSAWLDAVQQGRQAIQLADPAQAVLDEFVATWEIHPLGVHIRRTDLAIGRRLRVAPDAEFFHVIKQECDGRQIMLCTDNPETEVKFRKRFGDQMLIRTRAWVPPVSIHHRHTLLFDTAIDLYSLAKCDKIIGTHGSSFSEYAAALGHADLTSI